MPSAFVQDQIRIRENEIGQAKEERKARLGGCWGLCGQCRTSHGPCNNRVMPVFTPGSITQCLPAAVVTGRVVVFFDHTAKRKRGVHKAKAFSPRKVTQKLPWPVCVLFYKMGRNCRCAFEENLSCII
jgi:hypothetical protein